MTTPGEMWFQRSFPASAGGNEIIKQMYGGRDIVSTELPGKRRGK